MEIIIELSSADVDCFLRHIERRSVLGIMLLNSGFQLQSTGWPTNAIHCNEEDHAFQLLSIAREHCPDATKRIRQGLRDAGVLGDH